MSYEVIWEEVETSQMQVYFGIQLQDWNPFGHTHRVKLALLDPPLTEVCHL
jgi:hypothetical protein